MTPVINPWVFYAISIADGFKTVTIILTAISVIIAISLAVMMGCEYDWRGFNDKCKVYVKYIKLSIAVFAAFITLSIIIPSSNTITKMIIAQNVTYERVEVATDTVQTVYEDIMELFKEE